MKITLDIPEDAILALAGTIGQHVDVPTSERSPWMDVPGVAAFSCMKEQAIRDAVRAGHLKAHKTGNGRLRFHADDVDSFLRGNIS